MSLDVVAGGGVCPGARSAALQPRALGPSLSHREGDTHLKDSTDQKTDITCQMTSEKAD